MPGRSWTRVCGRTHTVGDLDMPHDVATATRSSSPTDMALSTRVAPDQAQPGCGRDSRRRGESDPAMRVAAQLTNWRESRRLRGFWAGSARSRCRFIPIYPARRGQSFSRENSGAVASRHCGDFRKVDSLAMGSEIARGGEPALLIRVRRRARSGIDYERARRDRTGRLHRPGTGPAADDDPVIVYSRGRIAA